MLHLCISVSPDPTATQVYVVNPEALQKPSSRVEKQPPQWPKPSAVLGAWNQILFRIEDTWRNRQDLDHDTKQREMAKACMEEGLKLLKSNSPTREGRARQLLEAFFAFQDADRRCYWDEGTLHYIKESEDDVAETLYQRGCVCEELVEIEVPDYGFEGARPWYQKAVDRAKSKEPYYQAKLNEFLTRRGLKP